MQFEKIDPKSLGRVAVLMGGMSSEREVSLSSGHGVFEALQQKGVDVAAIDPAKTPVESLRGKFDRVMISLHGRFGEDGPPDPGESLVPAGRAGGGGHPGPGSFLSDIDADVQPPGSVKARPLGFFTGIGSPLPWPGCARPSRFFAR